MVKSYLIGFSFFLKLTLGLPKCPEVVAVVLQNFSIIQTPEKSRDFRDAWITFRVDMFPWVSDNLDLTLSPFQLFSGSMCWELFPKLTEWLHNQLPSWRTGYSSLELFSVHCEFCALGKGLQVEVSCSEPCPSQGSPSFPWLLSSIRGWREELYVYLCHSLLSSLQGSHRKAD